MTEIPEPSGTKKRRHRSPSYPSMALEQAIAKAQTFYDKEGKHAVPLSVIQIGWGYSANSGPANMAVSALKKYGLLQDEGSGAARKGRLTEDALTILHHPDEQARKEAIKRAALRPVIHRELWGRSGGQLPSNDALRYELVIERNFSETGAREFMTVLRRTIAYAELTSADIATPTGVDHDSTVEAAPDDTEGTASVSAPTIPATPPRSTTPLPSTSTGGFNFQLPLVGDASITIGASSRLSEDAWRQLMQFLDVMKPSLTHPDE